VTVEFIARVKCDNAPCAETTELGVRTNIAGCGCEPGELEVDEGLTPFAQRWADLGNGRFFCPACWKDQFRFESAADELRGIERDAEGRAKCPECLVWQTPDEIVECTCFGVPLACRECEHRMAKEHDETRCELGCGYCERAAAMADRERRAADARVFGGLRSEASELFGRDE
jgi:hypothetical protein